MIKCLDFHADADADADVLHEIETLIPSQNQLVIDAKCAFEAIYMHKMKRGLKLLTP